jgi:Uri superfamily endonuclease
MKGIYVLLISVDKTICVSVGGLGQRNFQDGLYAYVGSAQNNLEKRIKRHLRKKKCKFWHIDYLLSNRHVKIVAVLFKETGRFDECRTARNLCGEGPPVYGFGSSDCSCKAHLFKIRARDYLNEFAANTGLKRFDK